MPIETWEEVAMKLGRRMAYHASCEAHHHQAPGKNADDCPACADRAAYEAFVGVLTARMPTRPRFQVNGHSESAAAAREAERLESREQTKRENVYRQMSVSALRVLADDRGLGWADWQSRSDLISMLAEEI